MNPQIHLPSLSKTNKIIIGTYVSVFILSNILSKASGISLVSVLGLSYLDVLNGHIYQLITFPIVDASFTGVLFNSILIWFLGSELEQKWGSFFYLKFLCVATYSSGLFYFILSLSVGNSVGVIPLYGLAGTMLSMILAYGIIYSERVMLFMLIFPMKAKYFCMILGAIELFMALFSNQSNAAWSHIVAMISAYLFLKYKSLQSRGVTLKAIKEQRHRDKMKSKLTLIKDDVQESNQSKADPENPKYWQ